MRNQYLILQMEIFCNVIWAPFFHTLAVQFLIRFKLGNETEISMNFIYLYRAYNLIFMA